jgi:hypothetical protein
MAAQPPDPYAVLGVTSGASDADVRRAYRRLVQRHHPDHNAGSSEAARRFALVQAAYLRVLELRRSGAASGPQAPQARGPAAQTSADPALEERIAALERDLRQARQRERAEATPPRRPTSEELGYITTEDSFTKILDDALSELFGDER